MGCLDLEGSGDEVAAPPLLPVGQRVGLPGAGWI